MVPGKLIRPKSDTALSGATGGAKSTHGLPADLIEEATRRLSAAAFIYAICYALAFVPGHITYIVTDSIQSRYTSIGIGAGYGSISLALLVSVVAWKKWLCPEKIHLFGLFFYVVAAFGIGMGEGSGHYAVLATGDPEKTNLVLQTGISWICAWILIVPLLVPTRPRKTIPVMLAAAAMHPFTLYLCWIAAGRPATPPGITMAHQIIRITPAFICVILATFCSHVFYNLNRRIKREREMGSYRLIELLGRGGMGEVWRAKHRLLARPAAIKLIRPDRLGIRETETSTALKRFEREAQATASLESPHTVDLFDFGVTDEKTFYFVMELLNGLDMETLVGRFGPLPAARVVPLLRQACHSLTDAHEHGLIHRDIKPANIFVCRLGQDYDFVKVLDFGLVRANRETFGGDAHLTAEGVTSGTPAYMPPEVALGQGDLDERLDLYSLGCVAYWLLTGRRVFDGNTPMEIVVKHIKEKPEPPSRFSEIPVPPELDEIILKCLEKDREARPESARKLGEMLLAAEIGDGWNRERARSWWRTHHPEIDRPAADCSIREGEEVVQVRKEAT